MLLKFTYSYSYRLCKNVFVCQIVVFFFHAEFHSFTVLMQSATLLYEIQKIDL